MVVRYARGGIANLRADFVTDGDVANVTVTIKDPAGATKLVVTNPLEGPVDTYTYNWSVPEDAVLGLWTAVWEGEYLDAPVGGVEVFEVVTPGAVMGADVLLLRSYLGDRLVGDMEPAELFFTDNELHTLLLKNNGNLDLATIEGWFIKMAQYAELVDHVESGAEQKMRQKFLNAKDIYNSLGKKAEETGQANAAAIGIVGKAVNLRKDPHDPLGRGYFWGNPSSRATYVRTWPLYRFPAILG